MLAICSGPCGAAPHFDAASDPALVLGRPPFFPPLVERVIKLQHPKTTLQLHNRHAGGMMGTSRPRQSSPTLTSCRSMCSLSLHASSCSKPDSWGSKRFHLHVRRVKQPRRQFQSCDSGHSLLGAQTMPTHAPQLSRAWAGTTVSAQQRRP